LRQLIAFISRMSSSDLAELEGVSPSRSHQLVAGALVAQATMRALSLSELEICPWALREGVILRRLDHSNGADENYGGRACRFVAQTDRWQQRTGLNRRTTGTVKGMTEHNGGEQPQKTVAELLAQHGAQVDGVRRRRRRADDDEQPDTAEPGGSRRKPRWATPPRRPSSTG